MIDRAEIELIGFSTVDNNLTWHSVGVRIMFIPLRNKPRGPNSSYSLTVISPIT